jgi:signal transduction histidine kinase
LDDDDDARIRANEATLHQQLIELGGAFPQVAAISVFGTTGRLIASSQYFPVPAVSVGERDDFMSARAQRPAPYYSLALQGKVARTEVFTTNIGRTSASGDFLGVVSIALRREYFANFYRNLTSSLPSVSVGLYRQDGGILVRYPDSHAELRKVAAGTPFTKAMRDHEAQGHIRMTSPVDGVERLVAFRRMGDYPLYVFSGISTASLFAQWWHHLLLIAAFTSAPCLAIWLLTFFSLRQLKTEELAWTRWQTEVARRISAEASSRQLQRMGALGTLVANVAHDFNNLLMVVSASVELAQQKNYNNLEKEVLALKKATTGAESLARRLMSVARKQPLKIQRVDLSVWLPAEHHLIATAAGEKVSLSITVAGDIGEICADVTELESAILNIAVNARDAMPLGGKLRIRCQNARLRSSDTLLLDGEYVVLACTDQGKGMTDAVLQRTFEPLFTTKLQGKGTGLGLAQVLAMAEQAGGTARIDSILGKGTTVRLYLPRCQARMKPETAEGEETPVIQASRQRTVLLVEDNEEVAAGVAAVLETFGCTVRHEITADKALEVLRAGTQFDFILSDVQMPGKLNGIDLAELVQQEWPASKIALMTGYADELDRATQTGVKILAKPFDIRELEAMVAVA